MKLEWSDEALADLDRFVEFLNRERPSLASVVAGEIVSKVQVLIDHPRWGDQSRDEKNTARSYCKF
jgi:plasmid stabilization system protein ParE